MNQIFIGTWAFGDNYWGEQKHSDTLKTIHASLRNNFHSFDTAPIYGNGRSEQILGQQLKDFSDVTISTKVLVKPISAVQKSFNNSLKRLNRSYVDYCFIHWPSSKFDVKPVITYLMEQKKAGFIHHIGLSNFNLNNLKEILAYGEVDIVQNGYNFLWPWDESYFSFCKKHNIKTQVYSPLAQGLLTGKITRENPYISKDKRDHMVLYYPEILPEVYNIIQKLLPLAEHEFLPLSRLILKWTLDRSYIDSIVVGCRTRKQVENLVGLKELEISPEIELKLNKIYQEVKEIIPQYRNIFDHSY